MFIAVLHSLPLPFHVLIHAYACIQVIDTIRLLFDRFIEAARNQIPHLQGRYLLQIISVLHVVHLTLVFIMLLSITRSFV